MMVFLEKMFTYFFLEKTRLSTRGRALDFINNPSWIGIFPIADSVLSMVSELEELAEKSVSEARYVSGHDLIFGEPERGAQYDTFLVTCSGGAAFPSCCDDLWTWVQKGFMYAHHKHSSS